MAFKRTMRVVVQSPRQLVGNQWQWTETEIDALHLDATITRSRRWNDNEMNLNIYNMSSDTSLSVLCHGAIVMVYAGYENDGEGLMFQGNIITHTRKSDGADSVDMVYAMCLRGVKDSTFGATPISMGYPGRVSLATIYERIATSLGLVLYGKENLSNAYLDSYVFAGTIGQCIDDLDGITGAEGCGVARDLGAMVIYRNDGGDSSYAVTHLSFDDGLLEVRDATDYAGQAKEKLVDIEEKSQLVIGEDGSEDVLKEIESIYTDARKQYTAQTIVMPKLKPNALVDIATEQVKGQFVVDVMEISIGNLPDSSFGMQLSLVEVANPIDMVDVVTYTYKEDER